MGKWAVASVFLMPLMIGVGFASPDLGLDITIDYVTSNNPNVLSAANVVSSVTGDLQGAIGGYQVPQLNGKTSLSVSGAALVSFVNVFTGPVNDVLRNITVIASQRQTAPSCMFATINATIDSAYAALDTYIPLVYAIGSSTSSQGFNSLMSSASMMNDALTQIATNLDALYKQVAQVLAVGGTVTTNTVNTYIQQSTLIQLSGSIAVATTVERSLNTIVRSIRSAFEQANNVLNSYNNDLSNSFNSINGTQRDYYNQIVSRVSSFQSKVTSDTNAGMSDIFNTQSSLNQFIQDPITRTTAQNLQAAMIAFNTSFRALSDTYFQKIQSQITQVYIGTDAFVKGTVSDLTSYINGTVFLLASTLSNGNSYASNCQGIYGGAISSLQNSMRDAINNALNNYASTGYTDSFVSEYNNVMREQTRYIASRIQFCLNLGSTSSTNIVKAGISTCFSEAVKIINTLLQDIGFEMQVVMAAINLESLAIIQRLQATAAIARHGLLFESDQLSTLLTNCQTSNS